MSTRPARRQPSRPATARPESVEPLETRTMLSVAAWMLPLIAEGETTSQIKLYRQELRQLKAHRRAAANHTAGPLGDVVKYNLAKPVGVTSNPAIGVTPLVTYLPVPGAYSPIQVETAYGITALGTANQGQGTTIGIVDVYDDSTIITATPTRSRPSTACRSSIPPEIPP